MSRTASIRFILVAFMSAAFAVAANAQVRVDVSGVGATQLPIAVAPFASDGRVPQEVAAVIRSNLARSGSFRVIDTGRPMSDTSPVDYASVRGTGAESLVAGSVSRLADGRFDIRYRLYDTLRQNVLIGESLVASPDDLRLAGHRISDAIYERLTGEKGIFSTRIAFVTRQGDRFRLTIADWDGENPQSPLVSPEPIISPTWSPDGARLAYVSFEAKKPVVYVHELSTGARRAVANFRGSNSAPAWAPDGRTLAVALTQDGLSQIYLINSADGSDMRRLTRTSGIDTEPSFSPDGKFIYFTSDRGGAPQIYRMPAEGGDATRITFSGTYNVSPRISPDGRQMAFVSRREGRFFIAMKDLASGNESLLTDGGREESPSFAPNGRWVMYTTREAGRDLLMATSVDGRVRQRLTASNTEIRESTWGPFAK
jgi:TolB protein